MDFAGLCGTNPRQALVAALRESLIPQAEDGAFVAGFDVMTLDHPTRVSLYDAADRALTKDEHLLVAMFATPDSSRCDCLALILHKEEAGEIHCVEPHVAGAGERMIMVSRASQRAFEVTSAGEVVDVPMPDLSGSNLGIAQGWVQLRVLMSYGKPDPSRWAPALVVTASSAMPTVQQPTV